MEAFYPCMFCEAVFVDLGYAKDHMKECHSKNGKSALIAHELGHNFAANHNEAFKWMEGSTQVYSTMTGGWVTDSVMRCRFSSNDGVHGNSTCNNIQHVQSTKTTVAGFQ